MGFEDGLEKGKSGGKPKQKNKMTLREAIDMGEYNPEFLATFPEWHTLGRHVQFQFIRQGLDNRRKHLIVQYAEINNILDFRLKPHLKEAMSNIEKQLKAMEIDREKLFVEYSK